MVALHEPIEETVRRELAEYDDLTAALLARRGITTHEGAQTFLKPSYEDHIADPFSILDMRKAAERIAKAVDTNERIAVWSDYDCDGIPGGVILHDLLKKVGANFCNYIPHRHEEGFGVNVLGIEKLGRESTNLLITVDCGITDTEALTRAKELGMDVILTDHHLPGDTLPPVYALIDPKARKEETSLFKEWCGAGLAWKLACAVIQVGREQNATWVAEMHEGWEKWLLDMAGLATIADMVPLVGENRVIAQYGLIVMRKSPRLGLQALCRAARVNQRFISEEDVGFMLAPRINAASRMGTPRDAFDLFTATDETLANELAKELEKANRSRRAKAAAITRAAHERLEERKMSGTVPDVIVMGDPEWRPGLLGLVANSLSEEYERPVFLWGREGGSSLKGSCRAGVRGVSVVEIMEKAQDAFTHYGGHSVSGGFTVKDDEVFTLEEKLCAAFVSLAYKQDESLLSYADGELGTTETTHELLTRLLRLGPFGVGNEKPLFLVRDARLSSVSWFGKAEEHLRVTLTTDGFDQIQGIAFYAKRELGKSVTKVVAGKSVSLLASLERDQFSKGRPVRLRLVAVS